MTDRLYRILCSTAVLAGLWAALAAAFGADPTRDAVGGLPLGSAHHGLILAAGSGLLAWALALRAVQVPAAQGKWSAGFVARLTVMVLVLNFLLMAQPAPPTEACVDSRSIGHGFRHFLNCDSATYMAMANDPRQVLTYGILQSRPLSFAIPFLIAQPFRAIPRLQKAGPYRPYPREFLAYLVVNIGVLVATLLLFWQTLEASTGVPAGLEILMASIALTANDVTKLFFWTPHTQIFNLFIPCLTVYLGFRLLQRDKALDLRAALVVGLATGTGLLLYGSFAVTAVCVSVIQLFCHRRLAPALINGVAALLPYACWVGFVYLVTGSFYNHEVAMYRQFVWMLDCSRQGLAACEPVVRTNLVTFAATTLPVVATPALLVLACRVARLAWPGPRPAPTVAPALAQSIAVTLTVSVAFLAAMGFYAPRLSWLLVPPIFMLAAIEFQAFRLSRSDPRSWPLHTAAVAAGVGYVLLLAARHGPYN